ncbi:glucose PTS transporter transcription antiterminator GlcT [Priestia taiwanensis]|uniref:PtsGHI operon antiterminator n=1 Tax=Priestia taiwanensis TaxID=1347902 RepID=A0A917ART4_9BACI|nr:transcription antiterminator [Priestia taiwanensis]MBM7363864.1 transcriptional antiterminator [Priestia taiwanensis]GGE69628.1 PtsGHI operon antiterminator [Priestia taiwanensis]
MLDGYVVKKVLNNNVIIATDSSKEEVVVIGKGIGFGRKTADFIAHENVEKIFILKNEQEKEQYKMLMGHVSEKLVEFMNEVISFIQESVDKPLNERIHIALTDHIAFAIKRIKTGMAISNPFLVETEALYPEEYKVATRVVNMIRQRLNIDLPEGEIGFIALHIYSAMADESFTEVNRHSRFIAEIVDLIEGELNITLKRDSVHYLRFVRHLLFTIQRMKTGEVVEEPIRIGELLKQEYPECYSLAWKIMKLLQNRLRMDVPNAEAVYLTMHLQRFVTGRQEKSEGK